MAARGRLHAVAALTGEQTADRGALAIPDALDRLPTRATPRSQPGRGRRRVPSPTARRRRVTRCGGFSPSLSGGRAPAWTASRIAQVGRNVQANARGPAE